MTERTSVVKRRSVLSARAKTNDLSAAYDYVMVFPMEGADNMPKKQTETAKSIMKIMEDAGLEIFPYLSVQNDELLVLIRCPMDKLKKFADDINYNLELDPDTVKKTLEKGVVENDVEKGGEVYRIKPVFITNDPEYSPLPPWDHIYGKYDEEFPQDLYYCPQGESSPFIKSIRLKLIFYLLKASHRVGGCDLEISKLILKKQMLCMFPLHDRAITQELVAKVWDWGCYPWTMPFFDYKEYFGEKITLYNVFIGHYSFWLIWPCIIGLVFQLVVWGTGDFSSPVLPFYSLIITVWSILMLEYWKRLEATTAMQWGMSRFEQHEPDRPEYRGDLIKSFIDGQDMLYFPPKSYANKVARSQSVITAFITMVLGVVASIYVLRFSLQASLGTNASTVASILNTVQITIFNMIYQSLAVALTNAENHRTDTLYEDSMIIKLFVFQFINSYASFFFLAFIAQNLDPSDGTPSNFKGQCGATDCMQPLSINLAIIFGTRLTLTNFLDIFIPYVTYKMKIKKETQGVAADKYLTPPEQDFMLMNYDPLIEGIKNYADTAIQYGFSLLFITALPCASFFSLVSNYAKVKFNTWKLATFYQRPIPSGAQDIGTWQSIFTFISVAAVVTNAALVCFTMDVITFSGYGKLWVFIGFQWTLIAVQFLAQAVVPDVPEEVEIQSARMDFINEKVIDKVPDEDVELVTSFSVDGADSSMHNDKTHADEGCCGCLFEHHVSGKGIEKKLRFSHVPDYAIRQYPQSSGTNNPLNQ